MTDIRVVVPVGMFGGWDGDDALDTLLRDIAEKHGTKEEWPDKYGTIHDDDVWMMHPFCWCEKDDCPWCGGCECPESAFHHFVDGKEVTSNEWMRFYAKFERDWFAERGVKISFNGWVRSESPQDEYRALLKEWLYGETGATEANRRRELRHDAVCDYCTGKGIFATNGAEPGRRAPNFWHKPSGFKVWFYKYIGRDMETNIDFTPELEAQIRKDCLP